MGTDSTFHQYSSSLQLFSTEKSSRAGCSFSTGFTWNIFPFLWICPVSPYSCLSFWYSQHLLAGSSTNPLTIARATTFCFESVSCQLYLIPLSFCTRREGKNPNVYPLPSHAMHYSLDYHISPIYHFAKRNVPAYIVQFQLLFPKLMR